MHCCICRMVRNSRNAIGGWRGSRTDFGWIHQFDALQTVRQRDADAASPRSRTYLRRSLCSELKSRRRSPNSLNNISGIQPGQIARDLRFEKLGLDSLAKIDLAVAAEDRFGIAIPDEDLERFVDVGDLLDYVHRATA